MFTVFQSFVVVEHFTEIYNSRFIKKVSSRTVIIAQGAHISKIPFTKNF